ncbi:hypothetical protein HBE96_05940 [Clostridium sp. P21]|uniref:Uncharacterized protein n=1 Tax=Clostridium muellerianum TaxID=2716538 RepID=A0A7Y0EF33_9CLOT|nr:hypothetical protein [Clostridium muellerianum]NMM62233.1 hypothetical protein [Clostridium muellerianum]
MKYMRLRNNSIIWFRGQKFVVMDIMPPNLTIRRIGDGFFIDIGYEELIIDSTFKQESTN